LGFRDVDWVADELGVDKNTVYRYLNDGRIPGLQIGKKWLIEEEALREWLRREQRLQTERRQATAGLQSELGTSSSRTLTMVFGDIAGASALIERIGDQRWQELFQAHNRTVLDQLPEGGHSDPKLLGDGFMVAFESAVDAVEFAASVQRSLSSFNAEHADTPLKLRIGLHTGEVIRDRDDFVGKTIFIASKIAGLAQGGQILVSAAVRSMIDTAPGIEFGEPREMELKPLSGNQTVLEVRWNAVREEAAR